MSAKVADKGKRKLLCNLKVTACFCSLTMNNIHAEELDLKLSIMDLIFLQLDVQYLNADLFGPVWFVWKLSLGIFLLDKIVFFIL